MLRGEFETKLLTLITKDIPEIYLMLRKNIVTNGESLIIEELNAYIMASSV